MGGPVLNNEIWATHQYKVLQSHQRARVSFDRDEP